MGPEPSEGDDDAVRRVLSAGSEITGSTVGAMTGLVVAGPGGAIAGAAVGAALTAGFAELAHRMLSRREQVRLGAAGQYASERIRERLDAGDQARDDGFFGDGSDARSDADEICEAALLTAQRAAQERKIRHIGYLIANVAFRPDISGATATWALRTAEELTWMQLVLIASIERGGFSAANTDIGRSLESWDSWSVHKQLAELGWGQRELIHAKREETERSKIPRINTKLSDQALGNGGQLLADLLDLDRVSGEEVEAVAMMLGGGQPVEEQEVTT